MRRVVKGTGAGIRWMDNKWTELDDADNIVLTCGRTQEMQRVHTCLMEWGSKIDLTINCGNIKIVNMNYYFFTPTKHLPLV